MLNPNPLHISDRRTVVAEVPADLLKDMDQRSEALRLAQFAYSASFQAGQQADFKWPESRSPFVLS